MYIVHWTFEDWAWHMYGHKGRASFICLREGHLITFIDSRIPILEVDEGGDAGDGNLLYLLHIHTDNKVQI